MSGFGAPRCGNPRGDGYFQNPAKDRTETRYKTRTVGQLETRAAANGGTFVNSKIAPIGYRVWITCISALSRGMEPQRSQR